MKITQVFNGHCDATVYGVVVDFEPLEALQHADSAYVEFNRTTREIISTDLFRGDEAEHIDWQNVPSPELVSEIEAAARKYVGDAWIN